MAATDYRGGGDDAVNAWTQNLDPDQVLATFPMYGHVESPRPRALLAPPATSGDFRKGVEFLDSFAASFGRSTGTRASLLNGKKQRLLQPASRRYPTAEARSAVINMQVSRATAHSLACHIAQTLGAVTPMLVARDP